MKVLHHPVLIEPLSDDDGGGFLATVTDLPDGETPEAALVNVRDAIAVWIEGMQELRHPIPAPSRKVA